MLINLRATNSFYDFSRGDLVVTGNWDLIQYKKYFIET